MAKFGMAGTRLGFENIAQTLGGPTESNVTAVHSISMDHESPAVCGASSLGVYGSLKAVLVVFESLHLNSRAGYRR